LNNTTITVINNYHNNTTYVVDDGDYSSTTNVEYNNTTINEGDETSTSTNNYNNQTENDYSSLNYSFGGASFGNGVNGTVTGGSMMFVAHATFSATDLFPDYEEEDYRNNSFNYSHYYYDYLTNSYRWDDFTFSCQVFYLIGSLSNNSTFQVSFWEDNNNYWDAWDNEYNATIADMLQTAAYNYTVRLTCDEDYIALRPIIDATDGYVYNFLSIDIPQGYAIEYLQLDAEHRYYGCGDYYLSYYRCVDPDYHNNYSMSTFYTWSEGVYPGSSEVYYGGWDNLTIDFEIKLITYGEYQGQNMPYSSYAYYEGMGYYSIWPTSTYEFTLYYQFVPVMPVE
jgi:hypothetical protein